MCKRKNCKCKKKSSNNVKRSRNKRYNKQKGGGIFDKIRKGIDKCMTTNAKKLPKKNVKNSSGFDLHDKALGPIKKIFGTRGMVPPPYKYLGPGNDLLNQLVIGRNGKIKKYLVKPYNVLDRIASKHDVCYENGKKTKNKCDNEMLKEMKALGPSQIPKGMGTLVKGIIGGKLLLGV